MENELLTDYLNAVYQNIRTAVQSLEDILGKVEDDSFKKELLKEEDEYLLLARECALLAKAEGIEGIKDNNWFEKARLWSSINMSTMTDKTNRHIAELLLLGTFMGYLTCIKDECDHKNISASIDEILQKLKKLEKTNLEKLLTFFAQS